ncbi:MAG: DNA primase [Defluviitaleaceae bacterium]|nr:DNA primase [Defluviitaleaceae bacterium]
MARYSQEIIEDVRHANDIVEVVSGYVRLANKAGRMFGLCPFHRENTPSFSVRPDRQMYHCFGCGASGNVISFVMQIENFAFPDAVRFLAERVSYALPEPGDAEASARSQARKERMFELHKAAARYFFDTLQTPQGAAAGEYLDKRGVSASVRRRFGLGFALWQPEGLLEHLKVQGFSPEDALETGIVMPSKRGGGYSCRFGNRLIFPIIDVRGRVVGFGGRTLGDGEPKYLNSQESAVFNKSRNLYGLNLARKAKSREYILVEGYMDVISLSQAGFENSVAALGTAFNAEHAKVLKGYAESVIVAFDSDEAGERAVLKAAPLLAAEGMRVRVLRLRGAKDPDEFIKTYGAHVLADAASKAVPYIIFRIDTLRRQFDITDIEGKIGFLREASAVLAQVDSATEREVYVDAIAKISGIERSAVAKEVGVLESRLGQAPVRRTPLRYAPRRKNSDKGAENARKNLIYLAANFAQAAAQIAKFVSPQEMGDPDYALLLTTVLECHSAGRDIVPAEIVSRFDELETQRKAADVFASSLDISEPHHIERYLNDYVRIIKLHNIEEALKKPSDDQSSAENLQRLLESKRNLDKLYITI